MNKGALEVRHREGVDVEWKSKAPIMERGHFNIALGPAFMEFPAKLMGKACHSAGWSDDVLSLGVANGDLLFSEDAFASDSVVYFAVENASGRAWIRTAASPFLVSLFDVVFQSRAGLPLSGASMVGNPDGANPSWVKTRDGSLVSLPVKTASPVVYGNNFGYLNEAGYGMPEKTVVPAAAMVPSNVCGSIGQPSINFALVGSSWVDGDLVADMEDYDLKAVISGGYAGCALPWPKPANWSVVTAT